MQDFGWGSGEPITKEIAGKVVDKCEVVGEGLDNILQFTFKDCSVLRIRFDWIYEWEADQQGAQADRAYWSCPQCHAQMENALLSCNVCHTPRP